MGKGRLEAFSDGVLAIIITIMVLELKVPKEGGPHWEALRPLVPVLISYLLSFIYIAIYWNNHHHLMHAATRVNGKVLWANVHLLFWLSLVPFVTGWMGVHQFAPLSVFLYGCILLMAALSYTILVKVLIRHHGENSTIARAIGNDKKGNISIVLYLIGILVSCWWPFVAMGAYGMVALIWLIPDTRIEKILN